MLIIISPAKTFASDPKDYPDYSIPKLLDESLLLIETLKNIEKPQLGTLMKMSDKLTELNWKRYQEFQTPFTPANSKQALFSFQGDVYKGIDSANYTASDLQFCQKSLRILSGLYGVLKPLDLIQQYRLEMGISLQTTRAQNLYQFWGELVTKCLNEDIAAGGHEIVLNLASQEYFKVIKPKDLDAELLHLSFKERKGSAYKTVAIHAKRARGLMVDYIIKHHLTVKEELQSFDRAGYLFNKELSAANEYIFTRDS